MSLAIHSSILFRNCNCNEYQMSIKYGRGSKTTSRNEEPLNTSPSISTHPRARRPLPDTSQLAPSPITEFHKVHFSHVRLCILRTASLNSRFPLSLSISRDGNRTRVTQPGPLNTTRTLNLCPNETLRSLELGVAGG